MSQYIYILLNPAHKSLLKIGRTSRSPEERALELSTATGVPLPFLVAYESLVSDSKLAENLIHEELASQGYRTNPSREFFEVSLKVAVSVVDRICKSLPSSDDLLDDEAEFEENRSDWGFLALGQDHMTGTDTILQDFDKARQCFEKAIALGNSPAYIYLSEIYLWGLGVPKKSAEAFRLLQEGGKKGHFECYYNLWEIFTGKARNPYSDEAEQSIDVANPSNADVAFRWYLDAIEKSNVALKDEKIMAYLGWVLNLTPPKAGLIGTHTNAMLDVLVDRTRHQMSQLRSARIAGIPIEKAVDKLTGKPLTLATMMEFKDRLESLLDAGPLFKAMLVNCDISDLEFGFSRLPSHRLRAMVAEYAQYLPLRMNAAQALPPIPLPVFETSSTNTHADRRLSWWNRIFRN